MHRAFVRMLVIMNEYIMIPASGTAESVERRLLRSGVIVPPTRSEDDSEDESFTPAEHIRRTVYGSRHDSDDEDSDFD
jgi:hypothetical protein